MGKDTKIQWAHHTFNHVRGCTKVSPGCTNCYAETMSHRNPKILGVWGPNGTRVVASEVKWREPLRWDREAKEAGERHRVFCASLADVFEDWQGPMVDTKGRVLNYNSAATWWTHEESTWGSIPMDFVRKRLFILIADTPDLDWLILTKRPESMAKWAAAYPMPPNVWLGTTVENRESKARIDILRTIPAAIRFLSVEPLIEDLGELDLTGIDWVIVGGESGSKARPFDLAWARKIIGQCREQGVAPFVKQLGANVMCKRPVKVYRPKPGLGYAQDGHASVPFVVRLKDSHGGDWDEWSDDLKVREVPPRKAV